MCHDCFFVFSSPRLVSYPLTLLVAAEVGTYLRYCRTLDFFQKPDYNYLRQLFWDICEQNGFKDDGIYDWSPASAEPAVPPQPTPAAQSSSLQAPVCFACQLFPIFGALDLCLIIRSECNARTPDDPDLLAAVAQNRSQKPTATVCHEACTKAGAWCVRDLMFLSLAHVSRSRRKEQHPGG